MVEGGVEELAGDDVPTPPIPTVDAFKVTEEVVDSNGIYVMDGLLALSVVDGLAVVEVDV